MHLTLYFLLWIPYFQSHSSSIGFNCFIIVSCVCCRLLDVLLWACHIIVPIFCFLLWKVDIILLTLISSLRRQSPFFVSGSKHSLQRNGIQPYFSPLPKFSGSIFYIALHILAVIKRGSGSIVGKVPSSLGYMSTLCRVTVFTGMHHWCLFLLDKHCSGEVDAPPPPPTVRHKHTRSR